MSGESRTRDDSSAAEDTLEVVPADESHFLAHENELRIDREEAFEAIRSELLHRRARWASRSRGGLLRRPAARGIGSDAGSRSDVAGPSDAEPPRDGEEPCASSSQAEQPRAGEEVRGFLRYSKPVGVGGLKRIRPWTRDHFWGYRPGRSIPSHLCHGTRRPTRDLCFWGRWESPWRFVLHTYYPGRPAPREIHDPEITLDELPRAIHFWTRHAIIVESNEA